MTIPANKKAPSLDRTSGVPLYQQLAERLAERIRGGEFPAGSALPAIDHMARTMHVSTMTMRQAIRVLIDRGILFSRQGKGTFVAAAKMERDFRQVLSFSEETRAHGATPRAHAISFARQMPDAESMAALRIDGHCELFTLRRVRIADELPLGIESSCIPAHFCPNLMEHYDPATSLYEALESHYNLRICITDEVMEVGVADAESATLLEIPPLSPVFLFTRISYLEDGTPVEHVRSVYRGDRYRIVNRLMRSCRSALGEDFKLAHD